ncbi:MAG: undecaprenyl-diphosphate phosphatase [Elusimicrobia bacterium]|nr:undecaprenyl-diphosphate phosphatase [Elusimicrobiota bacterium]
MGYLHAAILGLVQGLGEFLPISSSAHLVLVPWLFGWKYQGLDYDVALHWGTLAAVCAYFWRDWVSLLKAGLSQADCAQKRLFWSIALATVPGGLAGLLLEKHVEKHLHSPVVIALTLAAFGLLLGLSQRLGRQHRQTEDLGWREIFLIGCAQALAVVPGVSRSGATITAGLLLGLKRDESARFSFLLSVPIVAAAGIYELRHLGPEAAIGPFWFGILFTMLVGLACIKFLLAWLRDRGVGVFVIYRAALAAVCLLLR